MTLRRWATASPPWAATTWCPSTPGRASSNMCAALGAWEPGWGGAGCIWGGTHSADRRPDEPVAAAVIRRAATACTRMPPDQRQASCAHATPCCRPPSVSWARARGWARRSCSGTAARGRTPSWRVRWERSSEPALRGSAPLHAAAVTLAQLSHTLVTLPTVARPQVRAHTPRLRPAAGGSMRCRPG